MRDRRDVLHGREALRHLMDLLSTTGPSGAEGPVARVVRQKLIDAGCRAAWMREDRVYEKVDSNSATGNLIVRVPGTCRAPRLLFTAHLDTVPLCRDAVPVRRGRRIVPRGRTGLGADDRTGVACLVTMFEELIGRGVPRPPLTLLFTVAEEIGLRGARHVRTRDLGSPAMGFNFDSGSPRKMVIGAVGAERWVADIRGVASHAGVHPEDGVSAAVIGALAIAEVAEKGHFGRVRDGTSNVGILRGGQAVNQVMDRLVVTGESRSHRPTSISRITAAYRSAFERAAERVANREGRKGKVVFHAERHYDPFRLPRSSPVVKCAREAIRSLSLEPELSVTDGGLDANWLNAKGIPTVTVGAGQHGAHTLDEYVDIDEYLDGCRLAVLLATRGAAERGAARNPPPRRHR